MCIRMWPSRSVHACRLYVHVGVALFTCSALVSTCQRRLTQGVDQFIFAGSVALTRCIKPDPYQTAHSSTSAIDRRLQKVQPCGRSTRGVGVQKHRKPPQLPSFIWSFAVAPNTSTRFSITAPLHYVRMESSFKRRIMHPNSYIIIHPNSAVKGNFSLTSAA